MMDPTELTKESTTENANGGMQLFEKLHEGNVTVDVSGEYILPDYMPPVEKLFRLSGLDRVIGVEDEIKGGRL